MTVILPQFHNYPHKHIHLLGRTSIYGRLRTRLVLTKIYIYIYIPHSCPDMSITYIFSSINSLRAICPTTHNNNNGMAPSNTPDSDPRRGE